MNEYKHDIICFLQSNGVAVARDSSVVDSHFIGLSTDLFSNTK